MPLPEAQLDTWSRQGSVAQSAATYQTIRLALGRADAPYGGSHEVFLQGSYGNDTNIFADSDVDVVMLLTALSYDDTSELTPEDAAEYAKNFARSQYSLAQFRDEVTDHLIAIYGPAAKAGVKAIRVDGGSGRRDVDVLPAARFRRYLSFASAATQRQVEGLCFWLPNGTRIVNYPRQHSANLTAKHQRTASWFKPVVRILKNMRNVMVAKGLIADGLAPSYYVEGMLYNVPDVVFGDGYGTTLVGVLDWLRGCERQALTCANGQFRLLHPTSPMTWRQDEFEAFLEAAVRFWNSGG